MEKIMQVEYEVCTECGAVWHGNMFCNTCRTKQNEYRAKMGLELLPPWNRPAEKPCGAEEVQAFIDKLNIAS
jgi:hypothetical protein